MKGWATLLMVVMLGLAAVGFFEPPVARAQSISGAVAGTANAQPVISLNISPLQGDALIVFESTGAPGCSYILPPTDSQSQAWGAIGNCQPDTLIGEMQAFSVASYSSNQPTTINCNFGVNAQPEACYVFDIASPGVITLLGSAKGYSANIQLAGNPSTAVPNSLIIAMSEQQPICQAVSPGSGFSIVNPPSACYNAADGMAGEWIRVGSGGLSSNFPMTVSQITAWAELVVQVAPPTVVTTTTIYSATVIAWLVPDATHFSNTLILIILPLMGLVFGIFPFTLGKKPSEVGDRAIFPGLIGLTLGAALADLSVSGSSVLQIPFADVFMAAVLAFLWWWNS